MTLEHQVWLITGASCGIGREIAHAMAAHGVRLALAARREAALQDLAAALRRGGADVLALPMDVCNDASVAAAIGRLDRAWGRLDGIANVAGNGGSLARWCDTPTDATRAMFDVHVHGTERVLRAALPLLQRQPHSVVVNFASTVAWVPMPGAAAYSAAKAAVVALSDTWRAELAASGVDVRVFAPPHTSTDAGRAWPLPLPKIFEPRWVAQAFVESLQRDRAHTVAGGNASLLVLHRLSPSLARRIMHRIGFEALHRVETGARSSQIAPQSACKAAHRR